MQKFSVYCLLSFIIILGQLKAQNLPAQMYFDASSHILFSGQPENKGLYNESKIREFRLYFSQPDYWTQLKSNKQSGKNILALLVVDGDSFPNVGVRFKGNTSYSMVKNSEKYSFNITMDEVDPNQDLKGYSTINLNNCFEDGSMMREYTYLHQIRQHIPAAQASYVKLFINNISWGIYPNVQQINKTFAKEWWFSNDGAMWRADVPPGGAGGPGGGGWGDGTAGLNYLGKDTTLYKKYYTLKSSEIVNPWDRLVSVCDILNNTPSDQLEEKIKKVLDLDRTLWFLASEIAFSDDDSYIYKGKMDYYLYYDVVSGKMTPQEFDGNSVMGARANTWPLFYNAEKVNYPLLNKLLQIPSIRQRYIAHMKTLINEEMDTLRFNSLIRQTDALIGAEILADTKKLYTNAQYQSEKTVLMNFIQQHKNVLLGHAEMKAVSPTIIKSEMISSNGPWQGPSAGQSVVIRSQVMHPSGLQAVHCYYAEGLTSDFKILTMYDDGLHNDGPANDGWFGVSVEGLPAGTFVRFYIEAVANNSEKTLSFDPVGAEHNLYYYQVNPASSQVKKVVINELLSSNSSTATDEAGEFDDWLELFNNSSEEIDLSGSFLTDDPSNITKWSFSENSKIKPGEYIIVWCDENKMQGKYHTNFKLSSSGETVWFLNRDSILLDSVSFGNQTKDIAFARVPNGTGNFTLQKPTFGSNNNLTSVTDFSEKPTFEIYPNPANEFLHISLTENMNGLAEVNNIYGQIVFSKKISNSMSLDCSAWPSGWYQFKLDGLCKKFFVGH